MILHCWFCSLGGERLGEHSEVARIKRLERPVDETMFEPLPGKKETPFRPGAGWRYMVHPACGKYPWPQEHVTPDQGPTKVLTEKGLVDVPNTFEMAFECEICGWKGKTETALKIHKTKKHGG
jgi:hypothetical protein